MMQDPTPATPITSETFPIQGPTPTGAGGWANGPAIIPFLVIVPLVLGIRLGLDRWDRARIRARLADEGLRVERIRWTLSFRSGPAREYEVEYVNEAGNAETRSCLTTAFRLDWLSPSPPRR